MNNLITLDEYKTFVGKMKTDDDAKLNVIIPAISNLIQAYIGTSGPLDPLATIMEDIYLDYVTDKIFTKYYPIRELISVSETDRYSTDSSVHIPLTQGADYYLINDTIIRYPTGPCGFSYWPNSPGIVTVTYKAGVLDINGDPVSTPSDIKLAAMQLVSYYLNKEFIQNRSVMGTSLSTYIDKGGMPAHIARLLDNYKQYL
jgi:hypothetical protein